MNVQTRLRAAARAAGWAAEYEVRGPGWIADVLCRLGDAFVALEDQKVDSTDLPARSDRYLRYGIRTAWFTHRLHSRKIRNLIGTVHIFDAADVETVVPKLLHRWMRVLPVTAPPTHAACECGAAIGTLATLWCWRCWFRFEQPNGPRLARPFIALEDYNKGREEAYLQALGEARRRIARVVAE